MKRIPCEVIQDLLPSYIEHLTSETTDRLVEEHLSDCRECKQIFDAMRQTENQSHILEKDEKKELDFLKKNRKKNRNVIVGSILCALVLICAVLFVRMYVIGDYIYGDWIACEVQVEGNHLILNGTPLDSGHGISKVAFEEADGVVTAATRAVIASPIYSGDFRAEYIAEGAIHQVRLNDRILWDDGEEISPLASSVYETRHDYMGDMPANGRTAQALNLSNYIGAFLNELESSERPYGWKIQIQEEVPADKRTLRESDMESFGYILLGVIGNLDEVIYEYSVEGQSVTKVVTAEAATAYFGQDIKDCGGSVRLLDALIDKTGLNTYTFSDYTKNVIPQESIQFDVTNNTVGEIAAVGVVVYKDGVLCTSSNVQNADGSPIAKGQTVSFALAPDGFGLDWEKSQLMLEFTVTTTDGKEFVIPEQLRLAAELGILNGFTLSGSGEEGYRVSQ